MSIRALGLAFSVLETTKMTVPARLVLLILANRHNQETGRCDPSVRKIAKDSQLTMRAVQLGLRFLEENKIIQTVERQQKTGLGKKNLTNRYRILGGEQYAGGRVNNIRPNLKISTCADKGGQNHRPSAYDDLAMSIEVLDDEHE